MSSDKSYLDELMKKKAEIENDHTPISESVLSVFERIKSGVLVEDLPEEDMALLREIENPSPKLRFHFKKAVRTSLLKKRKQRPTVANDELLLVNIARKKPSTNRSTLWVFIFLTIVAVLVVGGFWSALTMNHLVLVIS